MKEGDNTPESGEGNEPTKKNYKKIIIVSALAVVMIVIIAIVLLRPINTPKVDDEEIPAGELPTASGRELRTNECGDGICGRKEVASVCQQDCISTCGDEIVQDGENWKNCRYDLLKDCGDGICNEWEHYRYCAEDCEECIVDDSNKYDGPNECPPSPRWA